MYITFFFIFFLNKQIEKQNIEEAVEEVKNSKTYQKGLKVEQQEEELDDKQHELKMEAQQLEIDKIKEERKRINNNEITFRKLVAEATELISRFLR